VVARRKELKINKCIRKVRVRHVLMRVRAKLVGRESQAASHVMCYCATVVISKATMGTVSEGKFQ
jgi:hypothetical protein